MSEREPRIILPRIEKNIVLSPQLLRREANGIDRVPTPTTQKGMIYADHCFDRMLEMYPDDYVIGPRLVDYMGDNCRVPLLFTKGRSRPDALVLRTFQAIQATFLIAIAEFKSDNEPRLKHKAIGFQAFPQALEDGPDDIHNGLVRAIGSLADSLPIYSRNIRPLGSKLGVIVMSKEEVCDIEQEYPPLDFIFHRIQNPQMQAAS